MDVNAIDVTGADGDVAELERLAAENVKRVVRGAADEQSPWEIARLPRAEDRLAPDRRLSKFDPLGSVRRCRFVRLR